VARRNRELRHISIRCIYTQMISDVQCLCSTARAATRELTRRYDDALRPAGLRTTQLSLLSRLSDEGSTPVTQLAARLGLDRTSLTREIAVLTARDLVAVGRAADRRSRVVSLTPAGRDALEAAWPLWEAAQASSFAGLGAERIERLMADLRAVSALAAARVA
jgi:DNA-binding MarR family transcriptional regulator